MACKSFLKKKENCILTLLFLGILLLVSAIRYDYYFDLNDDVLMKDILAGVYTGDPEGHNIQMLWLISALISVFYRVVRVLPWYGMFLCFCHFLSIGLIVHRSLLLTEQLEAFGKKIRLLKGFLFLTELFFALSFLMPHLVCAQYTVTCSMLAAAAGLSVPDNRYHPAGRSLYQEEHRNSTACIPGLSDPVRDASAPLAADLCSRSDQVVHGEENLHRGAYDQISVCDRD